MKTRPIILIGRLLLLLVVLSFALIFASCSTVSVTRTASGAVHAGVTSVAGKQGIRQATVTTRDGDTITVEGYSTQNPDPETTKLIRDGVLWSGAIKVGGEVLDTGIKEGSKLINTAIE